MAKIKRKMLHEVIADKIRKMIMAGELKEGDKVKEDEICLSMGISKTPLREALKVLSTEGLVRLVPNHGAYIYRFTHEEIKEMFDVMIALEGVCARTVAEKMTDTDCASLEELLKKMEESIQRNDRKDYFHYNNLYHSFVQKLAGNHTLNQIIDGLSQKILLYRFETLSSPERLRESLEEHRTLQKAFRMRDIEGAENVMKNHLKKAMEIAKTINYQRASSVAS
jgi:DNA-binding GntR family transcriptional regulator